MNRKASLMLTTTVTLVLIALITVAALGALRSFSVSSSNSNLHTSLATVLESFLDREITDEIVLTSRTIALQPNEYVFFFSSGTSPIRFEYDGFSSWQDKAIQIERPDLCGDAACVCRCQTTLNPIIVDTSTDPHERTFNHFSLQKDGEESFTCQQPRCEQLASNVLFTEYREVHHLNRSFSSFLNQNLLSLDPETRSYNPLLIPSSSPYFNWSGGVALGVFSLEAQRLPLRFQRFQEASEIISICVQEPCTTPQQAKELQDGIFDQRIRQEFLQQTIQPRSQSLLSSLEREFSSQNIQADTLLVLFERFFNFSDVSFPEGIPPPTVRLVEEPVQPGFLPQTTFSVYLGSTRVDSISTSISFRLEQTSSFPEANIMITNATDNSLFIREQPHRLSFGGRTMVFTPN